MKANKKSKAVTFSFDDGVADDIRLVDILNKYELKATFNLSAANLTSTSKWTYKEVKDVWRLNYCDFPDLYRGHEIACHGYTHPRLENLDIKTLINEIKLDKKILEYLYNCKIRGMAYPFGTYNDNVIQAVRDSGIEYSRTILANQKFCAPENLLEWHPTCHFMDDNLFDLAEQFLASKGGRQIFYIWGHSFELISEEDWQRFEKFCGYISGREEVFYGTNIEVVDEFKLMNEV